MHVEIGRARGSPLTLGLSTDRRGWSTACLSVGTETGDLPDFPNSRPNSREDSDRTSVYSILGRAAASWTRILLRGVCSVLLMDDQILQGPRAAEGDSEGDQVRANQRSNLPAQTMTPEENQERAPEFLLPTEPRHRALWEGTKILCSRSQSTRYQPLPLFFGLFKARPYRPSRALFCSVLLHFSLPFFFLRMPFLLLFPALASVENRLVPPDREVKIVDIASYLPALRAPGPSGSPGRGNRPDRPPARGSTAFHPRATIISAPPAPDNTRQTILQPDSPPELIIPVELRLPNVVLKAPSSLPKAPLPNPKVKIRGRKAPAPPVAPEPAELQLVQIPPIMRLPTLEVAAPPMPLGEESASQSASSGPATQGDHPELLVLSVEPGGALPKIALPAGNRYGAFSMSPFGGSPGSPGGVPGRDPQGGTGGSGSGGQGGGGFGPGGGKGGGGQSAGGGFLSISGSGGAPGVSGMEGAPGTGGAPGVSGIKGVSGAEGLSSAAIASLVYPVRRAPGPRLPKMVIMAGPSGGGGLDAYGVLRGGRVYTISLPMPGKNWVLQYCRRKNSSPGSNDGVARRNSTSLRLEPRLGSPYAEAQFDFRRVSVPRDKAHQMIVLRGVIRSDGSVGNVKVLRGLETIADRAAVAAFRRWKFRPATRAGEPITVEVLVGIPGMSPET